ANGLRLSPLFSMGYTLFIRVGLARRPPCQSLITPLRRGIARDSLFLSGFRVALPERIALLVSVGV
ncbi:MAG: hypothetical protein ACYS1E_05900, partial [Planctomycetota bacterium]